MPLPIPRRFRRRRATQNSQDSKGMHRSTRLTFYLELTYSYSEAGRNPTSPSRLAIHSSRKSSCQYPSAGPKLLATWSRLSPMTAAVILPLWKSPTNCWQTWKNTSERHSTRPRLDEWPLKASGFHYERMRKHLEKSRGDEMCIATIPMHQKHRSLLPHSCSSGVCKSLRADAAVVGEA